MPKESKKLTNILYSDFLSFSTEEFKMWWLKHMSAWLKSPYQENLFSPITRIAGYSKYDDIFDGLIS